MQQQQTISEPVEMHGSGLHGGQVSLLDCFQPHPIMGSVSDAWIWMGNQKLPASIDLVSDTTRSTTLAKGNIKLHTVEHMLSTFSGMSLDNVVVELDANEPSIGDGSSVAFL